MRILFYFTILARIFVCSFICNLFPVLAIDCLTYHFSHKYAYTKIGCKINFRNFDMKKIEEIGLIRCATTCALTISLFIFLLVEKTNLNLQWSVNYLRTAIEFM